MIVVLKKNVSGSDIKKVSEEIKKIGLKPHVSRGESRTLIGMIGDETKVDKNHFESLAMVEKVIPIMAPYKLVSREFHPENTIIDIKGVKVGGERIVLIAGPCSVESEEQLYETAEAVKKAGASILRAMAFKPRTGPHSFQGLGVDGLKIIKKVAEELEMLTETEVMDPRLVSEVAKYSDILHVGARNMQNADLLKEVGKSDKPVILKNGLCATIDEFLLAAEYILNEGNHDVILCHRGLRNSEPKLRFPLTLAVVPLIKKLSHLPIIVDPSHSTGARDLVLPMSKAAIAAGADGLMVEVHRNPEKAMTDGPECLTHEGFNELYNEVAKVATAVGRKI